MWEVKKEVVAGHNFSEFYPEDLATQFYFSQNLQYKSWLNFYYFPKEIESWFCDKYVKQFMTSTKNR